VVDQLAHHPAVVPSARQVGVAAGPSPAPGPAPGPTHADYGLEPPSQPWQDRYRPTSGGGVSGGAGPGGASRDLARSPRPYSAGGDVDAGGIKPWQLSHVRGQLLVEWYSFS